MFATIGSQRVNPFGSLFDHRSKIAVPIASVAGLAVGVVVALAFLAMPIAVIEGMAVDSGIAAILTAVAPPLGLTARLAVSFFAGLAAGGVTWFGLFLVVGARTMVIRHGEGEDGVPVLRRADAHPDAPPRRPVFANRDLGTPFLDVKAEPEVAAARDVPADLDTPIAAYRTPDDMPLPDVEPEPIFAPIHVPTLAWTAVEEPQSEPEPIAAPVLTPVSAPRFAPYERIETFGLAAPSADDEPSTPLPQATIHDLLERLERGVAKRQPELEAPREQTLEETLDALRALARRVG
jgi:hypothetical protein